MRGREEGRRENYEGKREVDEKVKAEKNFDGKRRGKRKKEGKGGESVEEGKKYIKRGHQ